MKKVLYFGHGSIQLVYCLLTLALIFGCATRYDKIDFCWTSDHSLPPEERLITIAGNPKATCLAISNWTKENDGDVLEVKEGDSAVVKLAPNATEKFSQAEKIFKKMWASYDANDFYKLSNNEWFVLKTAMTGQAIISQSSQTDGFLVKIKTGNRQKAGAFSEQIGTKKQTIYNPGFTAYGPKLQTMYIPGSSYDIQVPEYRQIQKTLSIYSIIEFLIYSNNDGTTSIYATGYPVDASTGNPAKYGNSIGHFWWPIVTGKDEAYIIKKVFNSLSELAARHALPQIE